MKRLTVLTCCASSLLLLSCGEQRVPAETLEAAQTARLQYDSLAQQVARSLAFVGQPLRDLNDEQMASVAALLVMTRVAAQTERLAGGALAESFWAEVPEICPPLPQVDLQLGDCLDAHIAYASAMARCLDEGKTEDQCDRETAGEMSATVICEMRKIEEMKEIIGRIPGRDWPPGPFPWPIEPGVAPVEGSP